MAPRSQVGAQVTSNYSERRGRELLREVAASLDPMDVRRAAEVGALARAIGEVRAAEQALAVLQSAPPNAFTAGIVTNIEDLSGLVRRELGPAPPARAERATLLSQFFQPEELSALHHRRWDEVTVAGMTVECRQECVASAAAVMGYVDDALRLLESPSYPDDRRWGPTFTCCVELAIAGDEARAEALLPDVGDYFHHWLASGFLGYQPYPGYPFPDY